MFQQFGNWLAKYWLPVLVLWLLALTAVVMVAPDLDDVVETGEFAFLPEESPSRVGENLFRKAFPNDLLSSSVVVVIRRETSPAGLTDKDLNFIDDGLDDDDPQLDDELREKLLDLQRRESELFTGSHTLGSRLHTGQPHEPVIREVLTFRHPRVGRMLRSEDNQASLVLVQLSTEFLDARNKPIVEAIQDLLAPESEFRRKVPLGLDVSLSGTAVVGRDMMTAARDSAKATEHLTVFLVVVLLIMIYRAPLLALIPLVTVFVAAKLSMKLLILMALSDWVTLFQGIESYVTVLLYGAGVDYCLFLIARYKEELDGGASFVDAMANSLGKVGAAVLASAGTVICGIGMMIFAQFGKFHEAGIAITFGLAIVTLASLTFTPTLIRLTGRWAFWPQMRTEKLRDRAGWLPATSLSSQLSSIPWIENTWEHVGQLLLKYPLRIWLTCVALMIPPAVVGVVNYQHLSYGLLSDLPNNAASVAGTKAVRAHFPAGATGVITALIKNDRLDFANSADPEQGIAYISQLTDALNAHKQELQLSDVRSVSHPFGGAEGLASIENLVKRKVTTSRSIEHYVSQPPELGSHVTRIDITADLDPFSRDSITHLNRLESKLKELLPPALQTGTELYFIGATASIRDLKTVTDSDQVRINVLVIVGVYLILVALLRRPAICAYLIISVLLSYLVTLGVTYLVYYALTPEDFSGLDWKVPMFLFTILIAVGEDYNIFLMSRIEEEQHLYGPVQGVTHSLAKTGKIISSCGIIMAGTFASLMAGSLRGMSQLGFALAFGVLLDTFVVRPVLVPAYLVLLHSGRFGSFGRWLGAQTEGGALPSSSMAGMVAEGIGGPLEVGPAAPSTPTDGTGQSLSPGATAPSGAGKASGPANGQPPSSTGGNGSNESQRHRALGPRP